MKHVMSIYFMKLDSSIQMTLVLNSIIVVLDPYIITLYNLISRNYSLANVKGISSLQSSWAVITS
jgi:hypothetical protein